MRLQDAGSAALLLAAVTAGFGRVAVGDEPPTEATKKLVAKEHMPPYSPYPDQHFPTRVFWGDTHHHSSFSCDAGLMGCTLDPESSFRFARGEEVRSSSGQRAKLSRPLDFLNVSDHAEFIGLPNLLKEGDPTLLATASGKRWYDLMQSGPVGANQAGSEAIFAIQKGDEVIKDAQLTRSIWSA